MDKSSSQTAPELTGIGTREAVRRAIREGGSNLRVVERETRATVERADGPTAVPPSATLANLRASVTAYVRALRAEGLPPEKALADVKAAVQEGTPPELDILEVRSLMDEVVRWTVETYYHTA